MGQIFQITFIFAYPSICEHENTAYNEKKLLEPF